MAMLACLRQASASTGIEGTGYILTTELSGEQKKARLSILEEALYTGRDHLRVFTSRW
jgi:hypothetical protein